VGGHPAVAGEGHKTFLASTSFFDAFFRVEPKGLTTAIVWFELHPLSGLVNKTLACFLFVIYLSPPLLSKRA
jgi:hypothetical protein